MKAIRVSGFGGSEQLRLEQIASLAPGPEQLLISVKAAGVNPVDTYIRTGTYAVKPGLPYTPGMDGAGVIVEVGSNVRDLHAGQRVYFSQSTTGAYAQECLCEPDNVHCLPQSCSFEEGAALGIPYATAYRALFQVGRARAGETVLIHGASGAVGIAAVQFARAYGLQVVGTASTEKGRSLVLNSGAHFAVNHASQDMVEQVAALTDGAGPHVILEMLANENLSKDLNMVRRRGRIVIIGNRGTAQVNMRDAMSKDVTLSATVVFNATAEEKRESHAAIRAGLESRALKPQIGRVFRLSEASEAHDAVAQPIGGAAGKIVLLP